MITDTLQHAATVMQHTAPNVKATAPLTLEPELIYYVNNFYDQAWSKLIWFVSIAGGLVAFVIPYLQRKDFQNQIDIAIKKAQSDMEAQNLATITLARRDIDNAIEIAIEKNQADIAVSINSAALALRSEIDAAISTAKIEISDAIDVARSDMITDANGRIEENLEYINKEFERTKALIDAASFQLTASIRYREKKFNLSFFYGLGAIKFYLKANDIKEATALIKRSLNDPNLKKNVTKSGLLKVAPEGFGDMEKWFEHLKVYDESVVPSIVELEQFYADLPEDADTSEDK